MVLLCEPRIRYSKVRMMARKAAVSEAYCGDILLFCLSRVVFDRLAGSATFCRQTTYYLHHKQAQLNFDSKKLVTMLRSKMRYFLLRGVQPMQNSAKYAREEVFTLSCTASCTNSSSCCRSTAIHEHVIPRRISKRTGPEKVATVGVYG